MQAIQPMLYFGAGKKRSGGATIAEAFRRACNRLVRKQWLVLYPLALGVINAVAFFAVYAADGSRLRWSAFLSASYDRETFIRDHFFSGFAFTPVLGVAIAVGLGVCLFTAMIRAPYFRAIAGAGYPRAPRGWTETARLGLFYLVFNLVLWVVPLAAPSSGALAQILLFALLLIAIVVAFADYTIVFESLGLLPALRQSFRLVRRRWVPVVIVVIVFQLTLLGVNSLFGLYYGGTNQIFFLLPLSQLLVQALLVLFADLLLIFLYEQARQGPQT